METVFLFSGKLVASQVSNELCHRLCAPVRLCQIVSNTGRRVSGYLVESDGQTDMNKAKCQRVGHLTTWLTARDSVDNGTPPLFRAA